MRPEEIAAEASKLSEEEDPNVLITLIGLSLPAIAQTADTICHNGSILTIDDANPRAEAVAVKKVNLIFGFGYDNSTLAELRHPTRDDLDQFSKDIPICLWHQSGHIFAINSKAIEIVGTTAETPNPQGGVIRHHRRTAFKSIRHSRLREELACGERGSGVSRSASARGEHPGDRC